MDSLLDKGERELIDLYKIARDCTFYPNINGSLSIKQTLLAVIRHSKFLQQKYSNPIYGKENEIKSRNYRNKQWVVKNENNNEYFNPYEIINDEDGLQKNINQGGEAAGAFSQLLFGDLTAEEEDLRNSLLRYELDTLAMAMITESWINCNS